MSKSVDERIVAMQFNNRQFESGVKESLGTIEKLKKGLNFDGATKSLNDLTRNSKTVNLNALADSVATISTRFTTMGIAGVEAIKRISNYAMDVAKNLTESLTIAPVSAGYADYERKLTSVQTVMNATGKSIDVVETYFNDLDTYADKTVFNLDDMTSSLGKFVNANISLDKSVPAIKGIANMTALAGQGSEQAAIGMYNLSQSIGAGFLSRIDFKSLENAQIATFEWKEYMVDAAVAAGTLKKESNGMYRVPGAKEAMTIQQLFIDGLQEGWASSEVLLKVLGDYGNEQTEIGAKAQAAAQDVKSFTMMLETLSASVGTGWTDTFELVIGDLEESKVLFTGLTKTIGGFLDAIAESRNTMLGFWKDNGGRTILLETLANLFGKLHYALAPIGRAFKEVFPPIYGQTLLDMTKKFSELVKSFNIGITDSKNLHRTFRGLFSIISLSGKVIWSLVKSVMNFAKSMAPAGQSLLELTGGIGDFFYELNKAAEGGTFITDLFEEIASVLGNFVSSIAEAFIFFVDSLNLFNTADTAGVKAVSEDIQTQLSPLQKIGDWFEAAWEKVKTVWGKITEFIGQAWVKISAGLKKLGGFFMKVGGGIGESVSNMTGDDVAKAIGGGLLMGLLLTLKKIIDSVTGFLGQAEAITKSVTGILDGVRDALKSWQTNIKADTIKKIAIAVGILALSILLMANVKPESLAAALGAVSVLIAELFTSMVVFEKVAGKEGFAAIKKVTSAMISLAIGVLLLAFAVEKMGKMDLLKLAQGLGGLIVILGALVGFMKLNKDNLSMKQAGAILILAIGISMMSSAISRLGKMDPAVLGIGLGAVAALLLLIGVFVKKLEANGDIVKIAIGIVMLGFALKSFSNTIITLGQIPWPVLAQGITALGLTLTVLAVALGAMPKKMTDKGAGFTALAFGLTLIAGVLERLGIMPWQQLGQGITGLGLALTVIVVAMNSMQTGLAGAAALVIITAALLGITVVLMLLGSMSVDAIVNSLAVLAGALGIIGGAGILLGPSAPLIAALGAALIVFGLGMAACGGGAFLLSLGLGALLVVLIPTIPVLLGFSLALAALIIQAPMTFVMAIGLTLLGAALAIVSAALFLFGPAAMLAGIGLVILGIGLLILGAGLKTLMEIDYGKLDDLALALAALGAASLILGPAALGLGAGGLALISLGNGIIATANGVTMLNLALIGFVGKLKDIPKEIKTAINEIIKLFKQMMDAIKLAIDSGKGKVIAAMQAVCTTAVMTINSTKPLFYLSGINVVDGFIQGIRDRTEAAAQAAAAMAARALKAANHQLAINSPSKAFAETGKFADMGLAQGLTKYAYLAVNAAKSMAQSTLTPVMEFSTANAYAAGSGFGGQTSTVSRVASDLQNGSPMQRTLNSLSDMASRPNDPSAMDLNGILTIQVTNDKGEIIGIAQKAIKDLLRKESR